MIRKILKGKEIEKVIGQGMKWGKKLMIGRRKGGAIGDGIREEEYRKEKKELKRRERKGKRG